MSLEYGTQGANSVRPKSGGEWQVQGVENGETGIAEDIDAEVDEETREPKKVHNPVLPSRAEMEQHMLTHVPFRSWCEHCVKGRGEGMRHQKVEDVPEQTEVHLDFCFMGDEGQEKKLSILAVRERQTKMTMSAVTPTKGENEFLARRVQAFLKEIGADKGNITVKSDQEPAMVAVVSEVARHRAAEGGGRTVVEHSAVGDSQGNGIIERAIKSIEGQVRVARSALEQRIKAKISSEHAVMTWLVEYVSMLLNRPRREYGVRTEQGQEVAANGIGVWGIGHVEEEADREQLGEAFGDVGQGHLLGGEGLDRGDDHRQRRRRVEDENGAEKAGRGQVEPRRH